MVQTRIKTLEQQDRPHRQGHASPCLSRIKKYLYIPIFCTVENFLLALQIAFFGFMYAFSDAAGVQGEAQDGVEAGELGFGLCGFSDMHCPAVAAGKDGCDPGLGL